ncbi:MAG: PfkB family carbohydrate kinase [Myxococcota bacterium]
MELLVVGSVAYDSVETAAGKRDEMLGGSATHFSLAAALFTPPGLVAVIGNDFKEDDVTLLREHGVELTGLTTANGPTFRWGGRYHADMNGRDTLFTQLNVFESFEPHLEPVHREASLVFLANIHPALQQRVLDQVNSPGFVALDTMNLWIDVARGELTDVLKGVDALFINDEEVRQLTGKHSIVHAAADVQQLGPELVIVKRGEHGAMIFHGDDRFFVPAFPVADVVDPTGAGDSFAGGFMGYLAQAGDLSHTTIRRAAVVGSIVASFCVEDFGTDRVSTLSLAEVRKRYTAFEDMIRFEPLSL